jgi:hypothetical protein
MRVHRAAQAGLAVLYLGGAAWHSAYTVGHARAVYEAFGDMAWLAPYQWLIRELVVPNALAFTLGLIAFEATVGILLLGRGRFARAGLLAGIAFNLSLVPALGWPYVLGIVPLIAALAALLPSTADRVAAPSRPARRPAEPASR